MGILCRSGKPNVQYTDDPGELSEEETKVETEVESSVDNEIDYPKEWIHGVRSLVRHAYCNPHCMSS